MAEQKPKTPQQIEQARQLEESAASVIKHRELDASAKAANLLREAELSDAWRRYQGAQPTRGAKVMPVNEAPNVQAAPFVAAEAYQSEVAQAAPTPEVIQPEIPEVAAAIDQMGKSKELELYRPQTQAVEPYVAPVDQVSAELQPAAPAATPGEPPQIHLAFVDQSRDARGAARNQADERLRSELNGTGFWRKLGTSIWKGNIAREYYRQRYQREALRDIERSNDINHYEFDEVASQRAKLATLDRFQSDYEEALHDEKNTEANKLARDDLKELIRKRIETDMSEEDFVEERNRIISEHFVDASDQGKVVIDNFESMLDAVRGSIEHGNSLDDVVNGMKITFGESRAGVRTEATYTLVDRAVEKLSKGKVGVLMSPEAIGAASAIAMSVARMGSRRALSAAALSIAPGAAAGLFAAAREHKIVTDERAQHARDMASGGKIEEDSARRSEMNGVIYEMARAKDLQQSLQKYLDHDVDIEQFDIYQKAVDELTAVNTRIQFSDSRNIDLIAYSDKASIEEERFALDLTRAKLKVALENGLTDEFREKLGLGADETVATILTETGDHAALLEGHISDRDDAFKKLRRRRTAIAGAKGAVTGMSLGLISQETLAALDSSRDGLVEQLWQRTHPSASADHKTLLQGMIHGDTEHVPASTEYSARDMGGGNILEVSSDHSIQLDENGNMSLVDTEGHTTIGDLAVNEDGSMPPETVEALQAHGMSVEEIKSDPIEKVATETRQLSMREYLANHQEDVSRVRREFWYDNDTPGHYERNELKLGYDAHATQGAKGEFVMSVANMTPDGSTHGGQSLDWRQGAEDGKLQLFVSGSKDTQTQAIALPIERDGTIRIDADSPAAKLFSVKDGEPVFHGGYIEVAETGEMNPDGQLNIRPIATMTGDNTFESSPISDEVQTRTYEQHMNYRITTAGYDVEKVTEVTPAVPVVARREMEKVSYARRELERVRRGRDVAPRDAGMLGYGYGHGRQLAEMRRWVNEYPGRLQPRMQVEDTESGTGRMKWVEADGSDVERSVDRERDTIRQYLNNQFDGSPDYRQYIENVCEVLGPMDDTCRVAVNIPAYMEAENLPTLLEEYMQQQDRDGNPLNPGLFEINIIVNRRTGTEPDDSTEVIENFIHNYADQHGMKSVPNIRYINVEFEAENSTVGYARKVITDATLLRSLMREHQEQPLYIESEDADLIQVDRRVVANLISKLDKNPHLDAVRGVEGRMPEYMKDNALLLMRRFAWESFLAQARQKPLRDPKSPFWNNFSNRIITGGWNTGYTAEAYAMIGGYENMKSGEDITIGERISMSRGDGEYPNLETIGSVPTRTESSPRRFIDELIRNSNAYDNYGQEEIEAELRRASIPELMEKIKESANITPRNQNQFEGEAQMFYNWCIDSTPTSRDAQGMADRVLRSVGLHKGDYEYHGRKIIVKDWSHAKKNIDAYRRQFDVAKSPNRKMILGGWPQSGMAQAAAAAA